MKNKSPVAIIDCATHTQAISCFNKLTSHFNRPFTYHHPVSTGMNSLKELSGHCGLIVLGSLSDVHERLNWQVELASFLKEQITKGTATLGICFGHQLVQDAFGGRVGLIESNERPHQGTRDFTIQKNHLGLLQGDIYKTFIAHNYEVKELAPGFIGLGSSNACLYDVIAHESLPYLSIQGHPEASVTFVEGHITKEISKNDFKMATDDGHRFIENFLKLVDKA